MPPRVPRVPPATDYTDDVGLPPGFPPPDPGWEEAGRYDDVGLPPGLPPPDPGWEAVGLAPPAPAPAADQPRQPPLTSPALEAGWGIIKAGEALSRRKGGVSALVSDVVFGDLSSSVVNAAMTGDLSHLSRSQAATALKVRDAVKARKAAAAAGQAQPGQAPAQGQEGVPEQPPPPPVARPMVIPGGWAGDQRGRQGLDVDPEMETQYRQAQGGVVQASGDAMQAAHAADMQAREALERGSRIKMSIEADFARAEQLRLERVNAEVTKAARMVDHIASQPTNQWAGVNPAVAIGLIIIDGLQKHFGNKPGQAGSANILEKFLSAQVSQQKRVSANAQSAMRGQANVIENLRKAGYDARTADAMYRGALLQRMEDEVNQQLQVIRDPAKVKQMQLALAEVKEKKKQEALAVARGGADKVTYAERYRPTQVLSVGGGGGAKTPPPNADVETEIEQLKRADAALQNLEKVQWKHDASTTELDNVQRGFGAANLRLDTGFGATDDPKRAAAILANRQAYLGAVAKAKTAEMGAAVSESDIRMKFAPEFATKVAKDGEIVRIDVPRGRMKIREALQKALNRRKYGVKGVKK